MSSPIDTLVEIDIVNSNSLKEKKSWDLANSLNNYPNYKAHRENKITLKKL
jgi:hypothetical protein